jgi:hypothetical protein
MLWLACACVCPYACAAACPAALGGVDRSFELWEAEAEDSMRAALAPPPAGREAAAAAGEAGEEAWKLGGWEAAASGEAWAREKPETR